MDLISNVSIDTHFTERGRIGRLIETVTCDPGVLGLGLSEDTSSVINNDVMEMCGSGIATIVDGNDIEYTNLTEIKEEEPVTVEGIEVHVLGPGKRFVISERKLESQKNG